MMDKKIEPKTPKGFNDCSPQEMIIDQWIIKTAQSVCEKFGFVPLDTPCVEYGRTLLGAGEETDKQVFFLRGKEEKLALRFDLTVSLARYIAAQSELALPFKRYQSGNLFRGEKPQAGRYRQFKQFDFDIVGSPSTFADAEIINIAHKILTNLGLKQFVIKLNNRKILTGLAEYVESKNKTKEMIRALDKLSKFGEKQIIQELKGLDFSDEKIKKILQFAEIKGGNSEKIKLAKKIFAGIKIAEKGISELEKILVYLKIAKIPEETLKIDFSLARGLDYYTGPIFETYLPDLDNLGSILSGGRFDNLVGKFSRNSVSATGASIGISRLSLAVQRLNLANIPDSAIVEVLIAVFDSEKIADYSVIAQTLREEGINTEIYIGKEKSLRGQIGYAKIKKIPVVIIIGEDEFRKRGAQVKNMKNHKQKFVLKSKIACYVKQILKK